MNHRPAFINYFPIQYHACAHALHQSIVSTCTSLVPSVQPRLLAVVALVSDRGGALHARRAKAARPALRVVQLIHLPHLRDGDALQDELRHTVPRFHCGAGCVWESGERWASISTSRAVTCTSSLPTCKIHVAVVEQDDANVAAVVLVCGGCAGQRVCVCGWKLVTSCQ